MTNNEESFESFIDELIKETEKLFGEIIENTKASDQRSKIQNAKWTERHRLNVLLEVARRTKEHLPKKIIAPWFLAELHGTVELIKRWNSKPIWKNLEPSLINSTSFTHTITKLNLVEHLMEEGHKVEIIPRGLNASPDLRVKSIGGMEDWVNIEVYQPKLFDGGSIVTKKRINGIVKKSMMKAKRQLEKKTPGILAICGFNQQKINREYLKKSLIKRLEKTERSHLCGISIFFLSILFQKDEKNTTVKQIKFIDFVPNPNYFGRINIEITNDQNDPRRIRIPIEDISSDAIISTKINQLLKKTKSRVEKISDSNDRKQSVIKQKLNHIQKPSDKTRVLIETNNNTLPLFKGEGNFTCICGNCGAVLVERCWKLSLNNIVFRCPSCQTYSEIPKLQLPEHPIIGYVKILNANYNFSKTFFLKRGVTLVGEYDEFVPNHE